MMDPPATIAPPSRRELLLLGTTVISLLFAFAAPAAHQTPSRLAAEAPPLPAGTTFSAEGKVVIITGSSRGIGKGIAQVFAEAGASVIVNSRHLEEAEATAAELIAAGGVASAFAGDVSVEADVRSMVRTAVDRYGGLDVLCANAGVIPDEIISEIEKRVPGGS